MDTTTPDGGASAQPEQTSEAVQPVIQNGVAIDSNGSPVEADTSQQSADSTVEQSTDASEAVSAQESTQETQAEVAADKTDDEIVAWSEKKGLKINPENPNEVKLARMQLEAERKMHEANQIRSQVQPPEEIELTGTDANYDAIAERLNQQEMRNYVTTWFDANPSAKEHRTELQQIAEQRPWLTNLDDVYAHFLADPSQQSKLKKEGGVEALTNLAQKQQAVPPNSGASTGSGVESETITPQNVYSLVDSHDQAWFERNHAAISQAMSGK